MVPRWLRQLRLPFEPVFISLVGKREVIAGGSWYPHLLLIGGCQGDPAGKQGFHGFGAHRHAAEDAALNLDAARVPEFGAGVDKFSEGRLNISGEPDFLRRRRKVKAGDLADLELPVVDRAALFQ